MLNFLKRLFVSSNNSTVQRHEAPQGAELRIGTPNDPIPQDYLEELARLFREMGIVKRSFYCLKEVGNDFSYFLMVDLNVPDNRKGEALQDIARSINSNCTVKYNGRWPLDFGHWQDELAENILSQAPELLFFNKD